MNPGSAKQLQGTSVVTVQEPAQPAQGILINMRTDKKPFNDVRVRQAISLAIDREAMLKDIYEGQAYEARVVGTAFGDYSLPVDQLGDGAKYFKRDVQAAKQLLSAAGFPDGLKVTIATFNTIPTLFPHLGDQLQAATHNLQDAGIQANVDLQDYAVAIKGVQVGQMDQMGFTGPGGKPDPDAVTRGNYSGTLANFSHVDDATANKMFDAEIAEFDHEKRKQIIFDIQKYLAVQQYFVILPREFSYQAIDKRIRGYGASVGGDLVGSAQYGQILSHLYFAS
jgi:peptide/nickel transport system substrate-binding protein